MDTKQPTKQAPGVLPVRNTDAFDAMQKRAAAKQQKQSTQVNADEKTPAVHTTLNG